MTEDLRLTVVLDETSEFPNNKNNSFKVRLLRPLPLPNGPWAMSLWTLSVPDDAVEQMLGKGDDFFCTFGGHQALMWRVRNGKYSISTTRWGYQILHIKDVFTSRPKSGVDLWKRVHELIQEKQSTMLQTAFVRDWRVQQPQVWFPTFRWEGEDLIKEADRSASYSPTDVKTQFTLPLKVCEAFGFFTRNATTRKWEVGPVYRYEAKDVSSALTNAYHLKGPTQRALMTYDVDRKAPQVDWFRTFEYDPGGLRIPSVMLSTALEWRFINLNRAYERMNNQLDTLMIYTDAVQSTVVGNARFPLLRSLQVDRRGQGRVTVEPVQHEWIPMNGQTLDTLEFQVATVHGPLTDLSPGQTIITVGLKPIKR